MRPEKPFQKLRRLEQESGQWQGEREQLLQKIDSLTDRMDALTGSDVGRRTNIVATTHADVPQLIAQIRNELAGMREAEHLWRCRFDERHTIMLREAHEVTEQMREKTIRIKVPLMRTRISLKVGLILTILADLTIRALEFAGYFG